MQNQTSTPDSPIEMPDMDFADLPQPPALD